MPLRISAARVALVATLLAGFVSCAADRALVDDDPDPGPITPTTRTTPVRFGTFTVHAELATTYEERAQGLMGRPPLPDTAGMLFVFASAQQLGFWMKNTPADLSIAFLDDNARIINIADMTANDDRTTHYSSTPARYALEVRRGWFADRGITPGAQAEFTLPTGLRIDP